MLENVNGRGFCWWEKVLLRAPPRRRMSSKSFPVTINCQSYSDKNNCDNVKDAEMNAICKNGANPGTDTCECETAYGTTNNACDKNNGEFTCGYLGEEACKVANNCMLDNAKKCICDTT